MNFGKWKPITFLFCLHLLFFLHFFCRRRSLLHYHFYFCPLLSLLLIPLLPPPPSPPLHSSLCWCYKHSANNSNNNDSRHYHLQHFRLVRCIVKRSLLVSFSLSHTHFDVDDDDWGGRKGKKWNFNSPPRPHSNFISLSLYLWKKGTKMIWKRKKRNFLIFTKKKEKLEEDEWEEDGFLHLYISHRYNWWYLRRKKRNDEKRFTLIYFYICDKYTQDKHTHTQ